MNDDLRLPELFHYLLDRRRRVPGAGLRAVPVLADVRVRAGRAGAHDPDAVPARRARGAARHLPAGLLRRRAASGSSPTPNATSRHRSTPRPRRTDGHRRRHRRAPTGYDPEGFRRRHGIDGPVRAVRGRREGGKGWERVARRVRRAVARANLPFDARDDGHGAVEPPAVDRRTASSTSATCPTTSATTRSPPPTAYIQPSALRELLAHDHGGVAGGHACHRQRRRSAVVRWHCERSGAGLIYETPEEFAACLHFVARAARRRAQLAAGGRAYVLAHYAPADVLDGIERTLLEWTRP